MLVRGTRSPSRSVPMGHPLQHETQALRAWLHQPDRLRTEISYAGRCRIANGVYASGGAPESLVRSWRTPTGEYGAEWDQAREVRAAIEVFRQPAC